MKLRLPFPLYRALINSVRAFALTCCLQPLFAQDVLEDVTIPQGTSETYTELDDFEGKSITVDGALQIAPSSVLGIERMDLTVSETGAVTQSGAIRAAGSEAILNIAVEGGTYTGKASLYVQQSGEVNIDVTNQGVYNNSSTIQAWTLASSNADAPFSHITFEIDNATFNNSGTVTSENNKAGALPNSRVDITLTNGAVWNNNRLMTANGGAIIDLNITDSSFYNSYAVLVKSASGKEADYAMYSVNIGKGGLFQNDYVFSLQAGGTAHLTVGEGGKLINNVQIDLSSYSNMPGDVMVIDVDGGSFENEGNLYSYDRGDFVINVKNGGDFLCKANDEGEGGYMEKDDTSSLVVNVEDGTFRNEATTGNADIRVGASGLMSGWGSFGSNDVYGTLIVGSGAIGLHDAAVKHQHYSGNFALNSGAELTFYIEDRDNYSQIFVEGTATGSAEWGSIRAAVEVTSEMMAKSVAAGDAFMNPGYIVLVDADGNEQNVSAELGIEYYGVGPFVNKYYYVDPETGSLLPYEGEIEKALLSGSADLIDTLWSSTGSVRNLARTALSQVFLPCYNAERTLCEKAEEMTGQREWQPVHCRRPNVWVAGLGGFMNMGGAAAFSYGGGGYAVGADAPIGQYGRVGAAFGQSFGVFRARHSSTAVDQTGIMFSVYGGFEKPINEKRSHRASAYFGYGVVDNDARTNLMGVESGAANWDDEAFVFGLEYAMDFHVRDNLTISPFIGIEYAYGSQSIYAESFSGGLVRRYDGATMQYWRIPVGCAVRHSCALGGKQYLVSELALGYIGDVSRHNPHGRVNIEGMDFVINGSNPARNAFMLRAGTNWLINEHWTAGAQYNLEARSGEFSQSVNAYVRYSF